MNKVYVVEKLTNAMNSLALGPGDIRSRLVTAHQCMYTLSENDFPTGSQSDWRWIINQLTKNGPVMSPDGSVYMGSVANTMRSIQNRTGVKIATRISKLYWELSENNQYS
jgi:hypothetical protein